MHHLLVHRRADRRGIAFVTLERRNRTARSNLALGQRVERFGRHSRRDHVAQLLEHVADQLIHVSQPPKLRRRSADDHVCRSDGTCARASMLAARSFATRSGACAPLIDRNVGSPAVVVEQRFALARVHLEPVFSHLLVSVIGSRHQLAAAALARLLAGSGFGNRCAFAAHAALLHPPQQLAVGHRQVDDHQRLALQHPIERFSLRHGPRKAVEDVAVRRVRTRRSAPARRRSCRHPPDTRRDPSAPSRAARARIPIARPRAGCLLSRSSGCHAPAPAEQPACLFLTQAAPA